MISKEQEVKIIEDIKRLVPLFLETKASDVALSMKTGISSSTVGRRLTNKEYILKAYPENGEELYNEIMTIRQENLQKAKIIGSQTSILNNSVLENGKFVGSTPKLRLDIFYSSYEKQMSLLKHIALTFKAKPELISELFGIKLEEIIGENTKSNYYLLNMNYADQDEAREKIVNFYRDLLNAFQSKNKEMVSYLVREVSDYKATQIFKNRKPGDTLKDEDIETIIKYQLKYALSKTFVCELFNIHKGNYISRVRSYLENHQELKEQYEDLIEYYSSLYWSKNGQRR